MNICCFCHRPGQHGARWILRWGNESHPVHRPCGAKLAEFAPKGANVKLVPSDELKREWAERAREKRVREFWTEKCPELLELRKQLESAVA